MNSKQIRQRFISFFTKRNHLEIPASSLLPEYDPTLLFTNAGMAPLKPYFLGVKKPPAKRLCNIQRCLRTEDLESVGNPHHHTFFEMLGSWSVGDYGKKEAVKLAFEFLTSPKEGLGLDPNQLYTTTFAGDTNIPPDNETADYWKKVGLAADHILRLPAKDNLWVSGPTGPCGPCTEVLYDRGEEYSCGHSCGPECGCGRFYEIWNAGVFMEYDRQKDGTYKKLPFLSVDTGAGLERIAAVLQKTASNYETDLFWPLIQKIETLAGKTYGQVEEETAAFRILADHLRASVFLIADGARPSNVEQGYILRKLIRRAISAGLQLNINGYFLAQLAPTVVETYEGIYPHLRNTYLTSTTVIETEEESFGKALARGQRELTKIVQRTGQLSGKDAFKLYDTYGLPLETTLSLIRPLGLKINIKDFEQEMAAQQSQARNARRDESFSPTEVATAHTAAHMLNQALKDVLKTNVKQAGQKISPKELRHDFTFDRKLTPEELSQVEEVVNQKIKENLPVVATETTYEEARARGAEALFEEKYRKADTVTLYSIGDWSAELCGGPHTNETGKLERFTITKQESVGKGVRRIRAVVTQ